MASRNFYWDNLRFVLIALVVSGHFITSLASDSHAVAVLREWIWMFHMPAFLFVSGIFAKRMYSKEKGLNVNTIAFYLIMFTLFYSALWLYTTAWGGAPKYNLLFVGSIPWYFLSLVSLCLLTPFISHIRGGWKAVIPVLVVVALLVSFYKDFEDFLSLGRTAAFAPFFFAGYFLSIEGYTNHIKSLRKRIWPVIGALVFLAAVFVMLFVMPKQLLQVFYLISTGHHSYPNIEAYPDLICAGIKLVWFCVAALMVYAVSLIVPVGKTWMSGLGSRTLQVYILHAFIYYAFGYTGLNDGLFADYLPWSGIALFFSGLAVAVLLAWPKWPDRILRGLQKHINISRE